MKPLGMAGSKKLSDIFTDLKVPRVERNARVVVECGGDLWGTHPQYPRTEWRYEVENGDTMLGYWEWVMCKLDEVEDDDN